MKGPAVRVSLHAAAFAGLAAALFAPGLLLGELPVFRDLLVLVLPLRQQTAEALWRGEIPLWSPEIFFGAPYLASWQSAVLYPPSLLAGVGTVPFGLSLYLAFHVAVAGLGTARYLERAAGLPEAAAAFGGVVFAFGGFFFSLVSLTNQLAAAAWLPWVLLAAERLPRDRRPGAFVALVTFATLPLLAGAPEVVILTVLLVAAGALRSVVRGEVAPAALVPTAAAFALAGTVAAAQILPTLEYLSLTDRAAGLSWAEVASESFEPVSLLQLLLPHTFEGGGPGFLPEPGVPLFWSLYLGVAPLVLVAASLAARPSPFWIATALVATAFAMGDHLPLFPAIHALAPGIVGAFRYVGKLFLPAHFALSVLAAAGFARALDSPRAARAGAAASAIALAFGLTVSLSVSLDAEGTLRLLGYDLRSGLPAETYAAIGAPLAAKGIRLAAFALATGALLVLVSRSRIGAGAFAAVIVATTFLDLLTVHQPSLAFTDRIPGIGDGATSPVAPGQRVFHYARDPDGRITPWLGRIRIAEPLEERAVRLWHARFPNLTMLEDATAVTGVDGFTPLARADFHRVLASLDPPDAVRFLAALGTERLVGQVPLPETGRPPALSSEDPLLHAYDLPGAAPRVYFAERIASASGRLEALRTLSLAEFRPGRDVVLSGSGDFVATPGTGVLESLEIGRETIRATATLDAPGIWVVADTWAPGWQATVDGSPAEVLRANGIHRAVRVPEGRHEIEMRYRPASFRNGAWISVAGLILLGAVPVAAVLRESPGARRRENGRAK